MGRVIPIIGVDGPGRFLGAAVEHPRIPINRGEVRASDGLVLVEQQLRTENAAVLVQCLGFLEVVDGFIDPIGLFIEQRHVQPARRIIGIQPLRQAELFARVR